MLATSQIIELLRHLPLFAGLAEPDLALLAEGTRVDHFEREAVIFYQGDEPKVHLHGAFGKKDMTRVGCLRDKSKTFLVLEAVIMEITGVDAKRELDPASGLVLLKL